MNYELRIMSTHALSALIILITLITLITPYLFF